MFKIKETCVGCHTCELACPMRAIDYDGPRYQIDPELCVECGLCETLCPTCSIYDDGEGHKAPAHDRIVRECDVVVCGGGSGLAAAVKLAQLGKKVILLEKAARVGGNTDLAHGFFPIYTKLHEERGVEDVREDAVRELSARTDGVVGEDLIRTAVYGCSEFFDWLLEFPGTRKAFQLELVGEKREMGPLFGPALISFPVRISNTRSRDPSIGPGWAGTFVKEKMLEAIPAQKLDVEILTSHAAKSLIIDETGAVTGVIADDPGGETEIRCKAVILATGGFGRSDEKLQKYFGFFDVDRPVTRFSVTTDTGDAIDMLTELGVTPDEERLFMSMFGPAHHPYAYSLYRLLEYPACLSVNLDGRRWQDESGGLMTGRFNIAGNPKEAVWGLFTQKTIDDFMARALRDPALSGEYECFKCYQEDLDREAALPKPPVVKADTVRELAEKLGMDSGILAETVSRYNGFCAHGEDTEFGKAAKYLRPMDEGPYYAVWGQRFSECAMGGIMVDDRCRVTRNDGSPIPGLYGVGDATSAMHRRGELAVISELTWAFASAYRSAINIAQEMEGGNED